MVGVASSNLAGRTILFSSILAPVQHASSVTMNPLKQTDLLTDDEMTAEQLSAIEYNLGLSIEERIMQLQSAVELIEELRRGMDEVNENRFQNPSN